MRLTTGSQMVGKRIKSHHMVSLNQNPFSFPTESNQQSSERSATSVNLPQARVKHIMKLDPEVSIISTECVFLVTKATELFIESLARESFVHTAQANKKTVQNRDVDMAIASVDALVFLEGAMNF